MDTRTIRLFDANDNLVPNFEEEVEKVLISIHGTDYYDTDEEIVNTNLITISNIMDLEKEEEIDEATREYNELVEKNTRTIKYIEPKKKISIKDFIPVLFFILIFAIIIVAGYYFLNTFDFMSLLK